MPNISLIQVITSKQRPRQTSMRGTNGKEYMFLLKGHEDLRQDERVMQFFSLVNSLLTTDPETFRRNLTIQRLAFYLFNCYSLYELKYGNILFTIHTLTLF